MTPEELGRIREIYERALPMSGPARDAFLEQESQGNTAIWREVERLLKAHDQVPSWLEQPFRAIATATMEGRRLSGYTLIREVGRGGMGSVYLAERSDGAFRKQAAIKLAFGTGLTGLIWEARYCLHVATG